MSLSQKSLTDYSYIVGNRFEAVNTMYLKKIAKQIRDIGNLNPSSVRRLEQMTKMSQNLDEINKYLAIESKISLDELFKVYDLSGMSEYKDTRKYYNAKGIEQVPFENNKWLNNYVKSVKTKTSETFQNISNTTVISNEYKDIVDKAIDAVATGVGDYNSVIRDNLRDLVGNGLKVTYSSGVTRRLDSAVRMNVLEGVRQINNGVREQAGKEFGADGVEISVHSTCAADHIDIQGKQFSLEEFEKVNSKKILKRRISTCNCKHIIFPIILGISEPTYSNTELQQIKDENNTKYNVLGRDVTKYEATQLMRNIETQMRYAKELHIVGTESGVNALVAEAKEKLKSLNAKYKEVCDKTGLRPDLSRAYVDGYSGKQTKPKNVVLKNNDITNPTNKLFVTSKHTGNEINIDTALDKWAKNASGIRKASSGIKYDPDKLIGQLVDWNDEARAEVIEKWIEQSPEIKGKLYRGLKELSPEEYKRLTTVGEIIDQKGLSSWTTDKGTAVRFAHHDNPIVFVQDGSSKARKLSLSYMTEDEVIMSSNARQIITKVEHTEFGYDLVYVKEVADDVIELPKYGSLENVLGKNTGELDVNNNNYLSNSFKNVNTNYNPNSTKEFDAYSWNCNKCVVAVESNIRGFNVEALPYKFGIDSDLSNHWYKTFGLSESDGWIVAKGTIKDTAKEIALTMDDFGEKSRAVLQLRWKTGAGHVLNVVNTEEGVKFIDGQCGQFVDITKYLKNTNLKNNIGAILYRVDDTDFDEELLKRCVKISED